MMNEPQTREIINGILSFMGGTDHLVSPMDLDRIISVKTGLSRQESRSVVRSMVDDGLLEYRDTNGRTQISLSFNKPVRMSPHVIVCPYGINALDIESNVIITLNSGTAFGRGDHPTTQLCVEALDHVLWDNENSGKRFRSALDIGTGSGILALAAAYLGIQTVYACDRDGVALNEARENMVSNKLENHIHIVDHPDMDRIYDMIIANLRYPTLIDLYAQMVMMTDTGNLLVFSGIKENEMDIVQSVYLKNDTFSCVWLCNKNGWSGVIYKKR